MACFNPFSVKHKTKSETVPVPCGKCPECRNRRASGWSFRLMYEEKRSKSAQFITLTYDTKYVPISRNGFMDLSKRDVQLFFKRLRKYHIPWDDKFPIKYYCAGEYGGKTWRPHYHIIIFNARIELIQKAWEKGGVHYGEVSGASIGYTLKYITKKSRIPQHMNDDRVREFSLMSKGLGKNYVGEWIKDCKEVMDKNGRIRKVYFDVNISDSKIKEWHNKGFDRMYCNLEDGKKIAMPRYYKDLVFNEHKRKACGYFAQKKYLEKQRKEMQELGDDYFRTKAEGEKAALAKMERDTKNKV